MTQRSPDPGTPPPASEIMPARLLRLAEIALKAGEAARADAALNALGRSLHRLDDDRMVLLLRLADRAGRPQVLADVIRQVAARPVIGLPFALAVLQMSHNADDARRADAVEDALAQKLSPANRDIFRVRAARMRHGPDAALALLRRMPRAGRPPVEAAKVGEALMAAGQARLALRYLRRCHRRWPGAPTVRTQLLNAFLAAGDPDAAREWLAALDDGDAGRGTEVLRINLAMEVDGLNEAREIMTRQIAEGRRPPGELNRLRVMMALGQLDVAEEVAQAIKARSGQADRLASHFGIVHMGSLLNEFRLYHRFSKGRQGSEAAATMAASNYFAAKDVLDAWRAAHPWQPEAVPEAAQRSDIPKRICQYWNTAEVPPSVLGVMGTWDRAPGWRYDRFDRRAAIAWLTETFGPDHARAFKLANHVAEESDFLRLCLLRAHGGIYADADDRLLGHPEDIAGMGHGMVLFAEPVLGAIQNNLICAPRDHPILIKAVAMACEALLRRDNDNTWSKTGPGLLTRAVAWHLVETSGHADADMSVIPRVHVHRHVHQHVIMPYKSTPTYWNARNDPVGQVVHSALDDLARSHGTGSPPP